MNSKLIAKNLQYLRKQNNDTQEKLAEKLNISRQAISKWETGKTIPDLETLLKLSKLYRISINDIVESNVKPFIMKDFEQITELPETEIKKILVDFSKIDIVKASMGASPKTNEFLSKNFPNIDFKHYQTEIGRIKITELEEIQNQIIAKINMKINA